MLKITANGVTIEIGAQLMTVFDDLATDAANLADAVNGLTTAVNDAVAKIQALVASSGLSSDQQAQLQAVADSLTSATSEVTGESAALETAVGGSGTSAEVPAGSAADAGNTGTASDSGASASADNPGSELPPPTE